MWNMTCSEPAARPSANSLWKTIVTVCLSLPVHKVPWPTWTSALKPKGPDSTHLLSLPCPYLSWIHFLSHLAECGAPSFQEMLTSAPSHLAGSFPDIVQLFIYLFFVLAKRRKSHRPKMNTNEMPSLASFVIRMKNRISAELQALLFHSFPPTFFFFFCPFLW